MIQFKETITKEIIQCSNSKAVETVINNAVLQLKNKGIKNHLIVSFIQKLDISLMFKSDELSKKQFEIIEIAKEILMNKILLGLDAPFKRVKA